MRPPAIAADATQTRICLRSIQDEHDHADEDMKNQERRDLAVRNGLNDSATQFEVDHQPKVNRERRQHRGHVDRLPTTIDHTKQEKHTHEGANDGKRVMLNVEQSRSNQIHCFSIRGR